MNQKIENDITLNTWGTVLHRGLTLHSGVSALHIVHQYEPKIKRKETNITSNTWGTVLPCGLTPHIGVGALHYSSSIWAKN